MKHHSITRGLLLLVALMFVLSSTLSAQTVVRPFNGTNLDGWNFAHPNRVNNWEVGRLQADATTFTVLPALTGGPGGGGGGQFGGGQGQAPRPVAAGQMRGGGMQNAMINNVGPNWRAEYRGRDIYTEQRFGDKTVRLEILVLRGGNSGVYLMGEYEFQIADSFAMRLDRTPGPGDMGGIWATAPPLRNAAAPPGTWQTVEIEFVAPRFNEAGEKTSNARIVRAVLNGVLVQENVEIEGPTGGGVTNREAATGPLMIQGDHGPVAVRNIEIIIP
jgi:hypothetical protein